MVYIYFTGKINSANYISFKLNIIIFGSGGFAKEAIDLIEENLNGKIIGFIDKKNTDKLILGYSFLGTDKNINEIIKQYKATHFFVAIGDIKIRSQLFISLRNKLKPLTIISKNASLSKYSRIGEHAIIYPGVIINAEVTLGDNVIVNTNVTIGHETKIGSHVNINPGANIAGKVKVNNFCTVGIGSTIKENLIIGSNSTIGAGAVVVKNALANKIYIGVPAEIMKKQ